MGYSITTLPVTDLKRGLWESIQSYYIEQWATTSTTYITIIKTTIDLTYVDYLMCSLNCYSATVNADSQLTVDGTTVNHSASNTTYYDIVDCTAITGEKTIELELKASAAGTAALRYVSLFTKET